MNIPIAKLITPELSFGQTNSQNTNQQKKIPSFLTNEPFCISQVVQLVQNSIENILGISGIFILFSSSMAFTVLLEDTQFIAGYGLGVSCVVITMLAAIIGLNTGMGYQQSFAYEKQEFQLVGILLYRGIILLIIYIGMAIPIQVNLSIILHDILQIDDKISKIAQETVIRLIPSQIFLILWDGIRQFMMAQREYVVPLYVQNVAYICSPFLMYISITMYGGGKMAILDIRNFLDFIILLCLFFTIFKQEKYKQTLAPFQFIKAISKWKQYLQQSLPVGLIVYLEWVFIEIMTIILARLNNIESLAAHVTLQSMYLIYYGCALALSFSITKYLPQLIQENKMSIARKFIQVSLGSGIIVTTSICLIGNIIKPLFTKLYSNSDMQYGINFQSIYSLYINLVFFGDCYQAILGAILKSCGRQQFATITFFIVYYCIGVPLGYILVSVVNFGLPGVWITLFILSSITNIIFYIKIKAMDLNISHEKLLQMQNKYKKFIDEECQ